MALNVVQILEAHGFLIGFYYINACDFQSIQSYWIQVREVLVGKNQLISKASPIIEGRTQFNH